MRADLRSRAEALATAHQQLERAARDSSAAWKDSSRAQFDSTHLDAIMRASGAMCGTLNELASQVEAALRILGDA